MGKMKELDLEADEFASSQSPDNRTEYDAYKIGYIKGYQAALKRKLEYAASKVEAKPKDE